MSQTRTIRAPWFRHGEERNDVAMRGDVVELTDEEIARGDADGAFEESPPRTLRARGPEDTGAGIDDEAESDDEAQGEQAARKPAAKRRS